MANVKKKKKNNKINAMKRKMHKYMPKQDTVIKIGCCILAILMFLSVFAVLCY